MVFVFEPIFLSYSPVPRLKGGSFGERLWDDFTPEWLKNALSGLVKIPVTPGKVRGGLLLVAAAIMTLGLIAGQRAKVGYSTPGTPLYRPNSKVNQDIKEISQHFPTDEGWVILTTPAYPDPQSVLGPDVLRMSDDLRDYLLGDSAHEAGDFVRIDGHQAVRPDVPLRASQVLRDPPQPAAVR